MKKIISYIIIGSIILSCREKTRSLDLFIPYGYIGDIELRYNEKGANKRIFKYKDEHYSLFLIEKDLPKITLGDNPIPGGPYNYRAFYYSSDTLIQLTTTGLSKNLIMNYDKDIYVHGIAIMNGKNKEKRVDRISVVDLKKDSKH